ncbi:MAG: amino acid ABC transporter permease [Rhodocyclaceae bacterium]|nr:amino acid ABC transporter permease [Rhodocyclaceae bacterium]
MTAETTVFPLTPPRLPPPGMIGLIPWLRSRLFATPWSALATLVLAGLLLRFGAALTDWALVHAVFRPDADACRAVGHEGACWGVVAEKYRAILFGRYPFDEQWRPVAATLSVMLLLLWSCRQFLRTGSARRLLGAWCLVLPLAFLFMKGGWLGLTPVDTARWGGVPLTLLLSLFSVGCALPLGLLLALGRRSRLPILRLLCGTYVEVVRGVPLVPVLFLASFLFPLFLPRGFSLDVLLRVLFGLTLFASAFLAEILRGGLQSLPRAQTEAAEALGLTWWQIQRRVVLPQVLRATLPSLMNSFISTIKETSLVTVVSLYELTGSLSLALSGDPNWRMFYLEGYLFIGALYWGACHALSRYSRSLERRLAMGR